jgi:TPR repeat protein
LLEQAADQGEGDAMFDLFSMFADGLGVARDYDRAMRWLEKDAATGDAQAQSALAYQYENNFRLKHDGYYFPQFPNEYEIFPQFPNVGAQLREAVRLETLAAKQGVFPSQMRLADLYLKGAYVEQDEERALEIIRGAADHGYSPALSKLADLYAHGIGEPRDDHDRVFELLCRAALSSDPTKTETYWIYSAIIERCEAGFGTDRDLVAAAQWYCRAALRNSVDYFGRAYYPLADKFDLIPPATAHDDHATRPVSAQLRPVLAACLKAAARRDAQAAIQLGTMYLTGKDAPRDAAKAWPWFNLASQYGATEAASNVSQAESKMTAAELVEARRQFPAFLQELQKIAATASIQAGRPGNP